MSRLIIIFIFLGAMVNTQLLADCLDSHDLNPTQDSELAELLKNVESIKLKYRNSIVIKKSTEENQVLIKSAALTPVCLIPIHNAKENEIILAKPHCFHAEKEKVHAIDFKRQKSPVSINLSGKRTKIEKLEMNGVLAFRYNERVYLSNPFNHYYSLMEAYQFAYEFQRNYGDSSYMNTVLSILRNKKYRVDF